MLQTHMKFHDVKSIFRQMKKRRKKRLYLGPPMDLSKK